jgi:4-hydroxybenzoate polyprenyltransferase
MTAEGSALETTRQFLAFSRHREWLLGSVLPLFGTFFLAADGNPERLRATTVLAWCAVFLLGTGCGYMLNNLSDLDVDRSAGKASSLGHWSHGSKLGIALGLEAASLALTLTLSDARTLAAIAVCHLFAWSYSFPPRFKEHVWMGPVVASAQFWAPSAVILIAWRTDSAAAFCWITILAFYGLRITIVHQAIDRQADLATGVRTTAVALGEPAVHRLLVALFSVEVILSALLMGLLAAKLLLPVTWVLLLLPAVNMAWRWFHGGIRLDTYRYVPLSELYETSVPLALAVTGLVRGWASFGPVAILCVLLAARHRGRISK